MGANKRLGNIKKRIMKRLFILSVVILISTFSTSAQETKKEIKDYINTEIILDNGWAGESITLIKEKKDYFIIRKIFGSGVPVAQTIKYSVTFNSNFQIDFSEIIENGDFEIEKSCKEEFRMSVSENEVSIYLNGLKVVTRIETLPNKNL
jgi:hypothetical protein